MKFTKKAGLAVAAFMVVGVSSAWADCPSGSEGLPNAKWSWTAGPSTTSDPVWGDISYSGNSGNGTADLTVTVTTVCYAVNPAGNVVEDKSTSTTATVTLEDQVACVNSKHQEDPAGDLCTQ